MAKISGVYPEVGSAAFLMDDFQDPVLEDGLDGFYRVKRYNNPLRQYAYVHRYLGKMDAVEPDDIIRLAARMVNGALPFKNPLVLGLSESSILLGRVVCEFFGGGMFLFSTRYPHDGADLVPFIEPHSHAPSQFLKLSGTGHCREVCIVEDEVTTGNTIMNLVRLLAENMPSVTSIAVLALKVFCSDRRIAEMSVDAGKLGIHLVFHSLYHGNQDESVPVMHSVISASSEDGKVAPSVYSTWEYGRGRIDPFSKEKALFRYKRWSAVLSCLRLPGAVTVIGASEAIDLAFEIARVLAHCGHQTWLRHLTISPWEVPGWIFAPSVPGTRPLHLYQPPSRGGACIVVYDHAFQEEQVKKLTQCLKHVGSKTHVLRGFEQC